MSDADSALATTSAARFAHLSAPSFVSFALGAARDPLGALAKMVERHGDVVRIDLGSRVFFLLAHPAALQHVFVDNASNFTRVTGLFPDTQRFFGRSLLTTEGDDWRRYRRMAQPSLKTEHVNAYCESIPVAMRALEARFDEAAREKRALAPFREMARASLTIIGKTVLGEQDDVPLDRMLAAFEDAQRFMARRIRLPRWVPNAHRRADRAIGELDSVLYPLIKQARQRADAGEGSRFLSAMMRTRDTESSAAGSALSDVELRDAMLTFFGAGYDTTASVLAFACIHLGQNAAVQDALRREVDDVIGDAEPDVAHVPRLKLATRALEEVMRLWPPIWMITRRALADDVICGQPMPAGAYCFASVYLSQRRAEIWPEPAKFDPERFLVDAAARPKGSYWPFGMGGHKCIGMGLAMLEMPLVLAHLLRRYRLVVDPAVAVRGLPRFTLVPSPEIAMRVERR